MDTLENTIKNALRCTRCQLPMLTQIQQCTKGHNFCSSCFKRIQCCPKCSSSKGRGKNFAMERLRSMVKYPCKYEYAGCKIKEKLDILASHEMSCEYLVRPCVFDRCRWEGIFPQIERHCEDRHSNQTSKEFFSYEIIAALSRNVRIKHVVFKYGTAFMFKWNVVRGTRKTNITVTHIGQQSRRKKYSFELHIVRRNTEEVLKKYQNTCTHSTENQSSPTNDITVLISSMKKLVHDDVISFVLHIKEDYIFISEALLEEAVLSVLRCVNCPRPLRQPITQCTKGHDYCASCYQAMIVCRKCGAPKAPTRNLSLEQVHLAILRPCEHAEFGCVYKGYDEDLRDHQPRCSFRPFSCPMRVHLECRECSWRNSVANITQHCVEEHGMQLCLDRKCTYYLKSFQQQGDFTSDSVSFYIFGKLFRFSYEFSHSTGMLRTSCYYFGDPQVEHRYRYKVTIMKTGAQMGTPCTCLLYDGGRFVDPHYALMRYIGWREICDENGYLRFEVEIDEIISR